MVTYATLTVPVLDIIGANFNESRASVWIEPNVPIVLADSIRVGGRREQVVNGVATFTNLVTTDSADNPASFGYRVTISAPPKGAHRREDIVVLTTSDFPFTATANLKDIAEAWDDIAIPAVWRSEFMAQAESLLAQQQTLADIDTPDALVAALVPTSSGSATSSALTATYVADAKMTEKVARALGWIIATDPQWDMRPDANTTSTDNSPRLQAILNSLTAANGGTVFIPGGEYGFSSTVNLPVGVPVTIIGQSPGYIGITAPGTRLRRKGAMTGAILRGVGTGDANTPSGRVRLHMQDIELAGSGNAGILLELVRLNESSLRHVRLYNTVGTGLRASEWFNSGLSDCYFHQCGNGRAQPAVLLDSPGSTVPGGAGGNTIHFVACEWEGNTGTDLRITSNTPAYANGEDWTIGVMLTSPKMERNVGDYPLIDIDRAGAVMFSDGFFHLGPSCTGAHVEMKGTAVQPLRPIAFANCQFSGDKWTGTAVGGTASVPYFIDMTTGVLLLSNTSMNGSPTTAFIHVGPSVGLQDVRLSNVPVSDRSKLFHDERADSYYGRGVVPLTPFSSDVTPTLSVNRPIWTLPDAATNKITYHTVTIPPDAAANRPIRVRVVWYSDAANGTVRWNVGYRKLDTSADITVGQTDQAFSGAAPSTANRRTSTYVELSTSANPGTSFALYLQRLGADAADTSTGGARVLGFEVLYERAL